jgi:hypothetical protein
LGISWQKKEKRKMVLQKNNRTGDSEILIIGICGKIRRKRHL